jgi:hypothetical protein
LQTVDTRTRIPRDKIIYHADRGTNFGLPFCLFPAFVSTHHNDQIKEINMKLLQNTSAQRKVSEQKEILPFRSEIHSSVVGKTSLNTTNLTGLGPDGVKISGFRLEQYLNACNPTCHG